MSACAEKLQIRIAVAGDAERLSQFAKAAYRHTFNHYQEVDLARYLDKNYSAEGFRCAISKSDELVLVGEVNGELIAYAQAGPVQLEIEADDKLSIQLYRLYVMNNSFSKGFGSALMKRIEEYAKAQGRQRIVLNVWENNLRAQRFYLDRGFTKVGEIDYEPIGAIVDREWVMEKLI